MIANIDPAAMEPIRRPPSASALMIAPTKNRDDDGKEAGNHHLSQRPLCRDGDRTIVVGLLRAVQNPGVFAELTTHLFDHRLRGPSHRAHA